MLDVLHQIVCNIQTVLSQLFSYVFGIAKLFQKTFPSYKMNPLKVYTIYTCIAWTYSRYSVFGDINLCMVIVGSTCKKSCYNLWLFTVWLIFTVFSFWKYIIWSFVVKYIYVSCWSISSALLSFGPVLCQKILFKLIKFTSKWMLLFSCGRSWDPRRSGSIIPGSFARAYQTGGDCRAAASSAHPTPRTGAGTAEHHRQRNWRRRKHIHGGEPRVLGCFTTSHPGRGENFFFVWHS